jgi:hypothetical protein
MYLLHMCSPNRRRPLPRTRCQAPAGVNLTELAARAVYVGSPEHKDMQTFAGQPRPKSDSTVCDQSLATRRDEITSWVREAIQRGAIGEPWEGDFPRYVWHKVGETVYEGRLVNRGNGEYKGWPLRAHEWPRWIGEVYG